MTVQLWIGTYPAAGAGSPVGRGEGIWSIHLDTTTGRLSDATLAVTTPAPSFLATHPTLPVLYAVNEATDGALTAFATEGSQLRELGSLATNGADPCHLVATADGSAVAVAHYSSGSVALVGLEADGGLAGTLQVLEGPVGGGPRADRQDGPHAHFLHGVDDSTLLVVDLGRDEIRRVTIGTAPDELLITDGGVAVTFPPGAGPRHIAFDAGGEAAVVAAELDGRAYAISWDRETRTGQITGSAAIAEAAPTDHLAHVALLPRGGFVVGVRGADVLREVTITADGDPWLAGTAELGGRWPRHHAVVGRWIVVAEQIPGSVAVIDSTTLEISDSWDLPSAACVLVAGGE